MNLCLDIGNQTVSIGVFQGRRLVLQKSINNNVIPNLIRIIGKSGGKQLKNAIISSVVPKNMAKIREILSKNRGLKVYFAHTALRSKLKVRYRKPTQLGEDRLVNAYGASRFFKGDSLIADFGTALTIDYISRKGVFEGGLILPGISIGLEALHEKTALLPKTTLQGAFSFPGLTTVDCMRGGLLKGYAALLKGIREDFKKRFNLKKCRLIVTGGDSKRIIPFLRGSRDIHFDPFFTLRSLNQILNDLEAAS